MQKAISIYPPVYMVIAFLLGIVITVGLLMIPQYGLLGYTGLRYSSSDYDSMSLERPITILEYEEILSLPKVRLEIDDDIRGETYIISLDELDEKVKQEIMSVARIK